MVRPQHPHQQARCDHREPRRVRPGPEGSEAHKHHRTQTQKDPHRRDVPRRWGTHRTKTRVRHRGRMESDWPERPVPGRHKGGGRTSGGRDARPRRHVCSLRGGGSAPLREGVTPSPQEKGVRRRSRADLPDGLIENTVTARGTDQHFSWVGSQRIAPGQCNSVELLWGAWGAVFHAGRSAIGEHPDPVGSARAPSAVTARYACRRRRCSTTDATR